MRTSSVPFSVAALIAIWFAPILHAKGKVGETAPDFPPGVFSDSMQYQIKDCRGKAVVLFFYESQCPRCKGSIPERNEIVKNFAGQPVKFIAVGAGDPLEDVAGYIQQTRLAMPVFVDNLGLMEARYGEQISLNNIWQMRVIDPSGKIVGYDMNKETIQRALETAAWKYDPKDYDVKLKDVLNAFEWNQWAAGMKGLGPLRKSQNKSVADSANKLYEVLKTEALKWKADADGIADTDPIAAYDLYHRITTLFPGEPFAKNLFEPMKKLAAKKAVEAELAARKVYEKQINTAIPRATPEQKAQLAKQLNAFAKKYDGTQVAQKAAALAHELE